MQAEAIANGEGWRIARFVCTALPDGRPVEERHERYSVSMVQRGSFDYEAGSGRSTLAPGAMLLGNWGTCFRCTHEHAGGDICLSFQYEPDCWEEIVAGMGDVEGLNFPNAAHPPDWQLGALQAHVADLGAGVPDEVAEELVFRVAGAVLRRSRGIAFRERAVSAVERRRIIAAALLIEAQAGDFENEALALVNLAREAGMTRYRFLRLFRRVVGITPRQFVLLQRMVLSGRRLVTSDDPVSTIAYESGFADLSTFNRQFLRAMGATPGAFRRNGISMSARIPA
ncbi:MAG TPA: AraC family transcriptional regulator [Rhabdaerophilum sp.]|nr:AraC family transcriptional regulator [Rhabdaerophilum sp.]